jgi:hypothetical protein
VLVDISERIATNPPLLQCGVAATDWQGRGRAAFVVAGFGGPNRVLRWEDGTLADTFDPVVADPARHAVSVAAADVDGDGLEELYVLNSDAAAGRAPEADRLFSTGPGRSIDLLEQPANVGLADEVAGRCVAALDRDGDGRYGFVVSSCGGSLRLYEVAPDGVVADRAVEAGLAYAASGRSLLCLPLLSASAMDVVAVNDPGVNFVFRHAGYGRYDEVGAAAGLSDPSDGAPASAPVDIDGDGRLDLVVGSCAGPHRLWLRDDHDRFFDVAPAALGAPSRLRTVIAADFDNDGEVELFFNNAGEPNRLFARRQGRWVQVGCGQAVEPLGLGTGAAVADIDGDGVLELLIAHGESAPQPLSLYKVPGAARNGWIRVLPRTRQGAPARGAMVRVHAEGRVHVRAIDAGSGCLGQMEAVAHVGLGDGQLVDRVEVGWPDGSTVVVEHPPSGRLLEVAHP